MEHAARRSALTVAAVTTVGALALSPITATPLDGPVPVRVSTHAVVLTDAWSDLVSHTATSMIQLVTLGIGANNNYPLPSPTIPLAPVATQLVLNQLIYIADLFTGNAGQIPAWIGAHLTEVGKIAQLAVAAIPGVVFQQLQVPFYAGQQALTSIGASGNPITGLFEAPAVFLDFALNNQFGLLGFTGPIGISLIFRNLLAKALYTQPPTIVLPFKKPAGALTSKPDAAQAVTPRASATPSGTAYSARSKPKKPSSSSSVAGSSHKAPAAKSGNAGVGRGKRG